MPSHLNIFVEASIMLATFGALWVIPSTRRILIAAFRRSEKPPPTWMDRIQSGMAGATPKLNQEALAASAAACRESLADERELVVRVKGGHHALREALHVAGVEAYEISQHHPDGHAYDIPGATGTFLDGPYGRPDLFAPTGPTNA